MMTYPFWPVTIAASVVAFAWVSGRLKQNAQPLRLELADKGEAVLACPDTSESARHLVRLYLDTAFSFRGHLLLSFFVIPFIAVMHLVQEIRRPNGHVVSKQEPNSHVQALIDEMSGLNIRINLANHPLLCSAVMLWMGVWFLAAFVLIAVVRGVIPSRIPSEEIAERVNHAYALIPIRRRGHHRPAHYGA